MATQVDFLVFFQILTEEIPMATQVDFLVFFKFPSMPGKKYIIYLLTQFLYQAIIIMYPENPEGRTRSWFYEHGICI